MLYFSKIRTKKEINTSEQLSPRDIVHELRTLEQQLRDNESIFNQTIEEDLIEACIYNTKALKSRYRYYHNMARSKGIRLENL